jgi:RNA polymerase sigma-70 factor, ECF subfamily
VATNDPALDAFRNARGPRTAGDDGDLGAALSATWTAARAAWPGVDVSAARWGEALAKRLPADGDPAAAVRALSAGDLYLALACAAGDAAALAHFERAYVPALRATLLRMRLSASAAEEALQVVRDELFVARPGHEPRIDGYVGRGALRHWLRAVTSRTALRLRPNPARNVELSESIGGTAIDDLELGYLKRTYGAAFKDCFQEAVSALAAKDRVLLKQRFQEGLGIDRLGALYGVHESTVSRWVTAARARLVVGTRQAMMRRLKLGRGEVSSVMRLIESQVDITLSSLPAKGKPSSRR